MIGDLFWNWATWGPTLGLLSLLAAASFAVAHVPSMLVRFVPAIGAYAKAAIVVQVLASSALMICIGYRIADERAELRNVRFQLSWKQHELDQQKQSAEQAAELAKQNKEAADSLQSKVDDYAEQLSNRPVGDCAFDDDDLGRLRALGRDARRPQRSYPEGLRKSGG